MEKVKVYKIGEAVQSRNTGNKVVGAIEYAILVNDKTAVLIENDACHLIKDLPETIKIGVAKEEYGKIKIFPEGYLYPTVEWILENVKSYEVELPEWIIYYKIKSRIIENCNLLKQTLKDLGFDVKKYFE